MPISIKMYKRFFCLLPQDFIPSKKMFCEQQNTPMMIVMG